MKAYAIIHDDNKPSVTSSSFDYLRYIGNHSEKVRIVTFYYDPAEAVEVDSMTNDEFKQTEEGAYLR
jgi:hypothetical protein